jgi:hypothetical protein
MVNWIQAAAKHPKTLTTVKQGNKQPMNDIEARIAALKKKSNLNPGESKLLQKLQYAKNAYNYNRSGG